MASVYPSNKNGKVVSYKFKTCVGRDEQKKQVIRCTTWIPPQDLTPAKMQRAAERAAEGAGSERTGHRLRTAPGETPG